MATARSPIDKIPFTCPHCGHHTEVELRFAGQSGPCVSCSNTITVPTVESIAAGLARKRGATRAPAWIKAGMVFGGMLSVAMLGVVVWSIVQPAFRAAREASMCSACEVNLREIGMALDEYYQQHGNYPPAVVYDDNGAPMHSWRVLLLPHLGPEANQVYAQYNMDQPFDGPDNKNLISQMPSIYSCPADTQAILGETSYLAVVGERTLINAVKPVQRSGDYDGPILTDNPAETMVVVEASGCTVNWLKPKDIPVAALRAGLNSKNPSAPRSQHPQGVNILMADQSIIRLQDWVSSDDLRAMAIIDGGNEYIEALETVDNPGERFP